MTREWAFGGSRGAVDVCIVDSGVEPGHPLVGAARERPGGRPRRRGASRSSRTTRGDVCGHGTACAGIVRSLAPDCRLHSRPRARSRGDRRGRPDPRGPPPRDRGRSPGDQPQPLDDEAPLRRGAARARRPRLLQPDDPRRVGPQPPGGQLPVALLVRHLGRQPRGARPARLVREPRRRPSSSSRAASTSRSRGSGGGIAPLHRQQLRGAAHRRGRGARAREAPGADAVPAEERPPPDRDEHRRST